ncbi:MAG: L-aspartate oxidase [Ruminococcaceae bacterium]|nr:L-aspartate oxidase [Oscillospiraceae bacterium]
MKKHYDVLVIGTGAAGLYGALHISPELEVLSVCKREVLLSNSDLAQGGIAAVTMKDDSYDSHINDTMIAGGHTNNPDSVYELITEGPKDVMNLARLGVEFDKNEDGSYNMTLEGGHSMPRILHRKDSTGNAIVTALSKIVSKLANVTISENTQVINLVKKDGMFFATLLANDEQSVVSADYVLMATGGIGRVYEYTTNSKIATGDGIALAHKMGAVVENMNLIQFHPTAFAHEDRERLLISESVRGEGAYLLNCNFERFMHNYDERCELAPRDVVSRCIMQEEKKTGSNKFYLNISHEDPKFVIDRFPMLFEKLLAEGFDMTRDNIPVYPCQHYLMGGIKVDLNGQTTIEDLYAAGECSHTGVHGNNRLASNSLLEAVVFGRLAAQEINKKAQKGKKPEVAEPENMLLKSGKTPLPHGFRTKIRHLLQKGFYVVPDVEAAKNSLNEVKEIEKILENEDYTLSMDLVEARNAAVIAGIILNDVIRANS